MFATVNFDEDKNNGRCFTTTNSHYMTTGAPARMADGRLFSDYRARCLSYPVRAAGVFGDYEARQKMIHGGNELIGATHQMLDMKNSSSTVVDTMLPSMYKRVCTWKGCKTIGNQPYGIGTDTLYVPAAQGSISDPDALTSTLPPLPGTREIIRPAQPSMCNATDKEAMWSVSGPSTAKSHPYSFPRN
jgi:hypothetical protein